MKICDILQFNKDKYFGGAVQANWFYDDDKVYAVADSYVFHGPKYNGVKQGTDQSYQLNDTATYARKLLKKAGENESNRFNMTITGYGTGKSHLAVALAAFLSGHDADLRDIVARNIAAADREIGQEIGAYQGKNLVLVLNGMRNFNLNSEILSAAKKALAQHGLSAEIFDVLTTQYRQAIHFCRNTYDMYMQSYANHLADTSLGKNADLSEIITALENTNSEVFTAVNEVYKEFMGTYIHAENDISAADVLSLLVRKYCIDDEIFDRIYILFDEFGRYIEFTANNPHIADDAALQQIFETVQNADGHIVFDAFIQSDLNSYIRRVESTNSNISRYVGRYENSEKFYLSSNFETILANLIEKRDEARFNGLIAHNIDDVYEKFHKNIFMDLCRWAAPEIEHRSVWSTQKMYFDVIAKGCYPIHPITVWFLANTSSWMQQRSTIAYTAEMFEQIKEREISGRWLPYIYPADIVGTDLFEEMLGSEEKGFVQSHNCMIYRTIITKTGDKLDDNAVKVLRAIMICNILKFRFFDKNDCLTGIRYCSGLNEDDVAAAIAALENDYCVIGFDSDHMRYDLNAEAHGKQEYSLCVSKKIILLRNFNPISEMDEELIGELKLNTPENTAFSQIHNISSPEWQFEKRLVNIDEVNEMYCRSLINRLANAATGEDCRGMIVYLYAGKTLERDVPIVQNLIRVLEMSKLPIVFCLLKDQEENWLYYLRRRAAYRKFTESEKEIYARFVQKDNRFVLRKVVSDFNHMAGEKCILSEDGIQNISVRFNEYFGSKFLEIYPRAIPFCITEFEKKVTPGARKILLSMCRNMYSGVMCNKQSYQGLDPNEKRRIMTALSTASKKTSWQVFDSNYNLREPKNSRVKDLYQDALQKFSIESQHTISQIFGEYRFAPYGLNYYALFLFIIYMLSLHSKKINLYDGTTLLTKQEFIDRYLSSDKKMLENLFKLRVGLKTQNDDEILDDLLKEIEAITYTENCADLLKTLKELTIDYEGERKGDIAACILKLQQGAKTNSNLYGELTKRENMLQKSADPFNLVGVVTILRNTKPQAPDIQIDEYSEYKYSPTYCSRRQKLLSDAEQLLTENFSSFVTSLKCTYAGSGEFSKTYGKAAKALQEIGKKEYADKLKKRIDEVVESAELEARYAATLNDSERFIIAVTNSLPTADYADIAEAAIQIQSWLDTFANAADMPEQARNERLTKLNDLSKIADKRKTELDEQLQAALRAIEKPEETSVQLAQRIAKMLRLKPSEESAILLTSAAQVIEEYHQLKARVVNADNETLTRLESDYTNRWKGTVCDKYVQELIQSIRDKIRQNRDEWMRKNVESIRGQLENMVTAQCVQWQNSITDLPEYLSDEDLAEITQLSEVITQKIKAQRINGVVELFSSLSDEEKTECLRKLLDLKN